MGWAISYQVMADESAGKDSKNENGKLVLSSKAIEYGIEMMDSVQPPATRVRENPFQLQNA